ncbi:DDE-type integrase/transposase/recombinase [Streptomyces avidinii]|uniref:DDE-type integrase/transposase/recombinase n=1 Tax=Streptomyces avidinii TaxID=1895 RepID=UPI00386A3C75|nr:DDE-type integrase/transposase/recombinase [Streptomyces avidinii]
MTSPTSPPTKACCIWRPGWTWLDLATREIVGYSMADHHRASLVVDARAMAGGRGRLQPGCIVHSDRGSEHTSDELRCAISWLGLRQSMVRTGSCYDNAAAESFFALLKAEIGTRRWPDRTTARAEFFTSRSARPSGTWTGF